MKQDAFLLFQIVPYFPKVTIHVVVIDLGVGSKRRRLIIAGTRSFYVGPDNGVLSLAVKKEGIVKTVEICEKKYIFPNPSTYDDRDVFAPASAHLAMGVKVEEIGPEATYPVTLHFPKPIVKKGRIIGQVLYIDHFGNIITNIHYTHLKAINVGDGEFLKLKTNRIIKKTYDFLKLTHKYPLGASS